MKRLAFKLLIIASACSIAQAKYSGGSGEPNEPYQIANVTDLLTLANDVNDYNKCFILTADIDLEGQLFTTAVIAHDLDNTNYEFDGIPFAGIFDGADHKILNLTINTNGLENDYLGLLGYINAGIVKNLGIETVSIIDEYSSADYIGGLVGEISQSAIKECYSTGTIIRGNASYFLGGLVGRNYNDACISNCFSSVAITGGISSGCLGGLVGYNAGGSIINCYSTGIVTSGDSSAWIGGLVGESGHKISSSYFLATSGPNNGYGVPLTDEEMKQQANFLGWDFVWETVNGPNDIWAICEDVSYPKLAWQFIVGDFDNDKDVDFVDFALMGNNWRQADSNLYCGGSDLTGDQWVDLNDLAILCENWLGE